MQKWFSCTTKFCNLSQKFEIYETNTTISAITVLKNETFEENRILLSFEFEFKVVRLCVQVCIGRQKWIINRIRFISASILLPVTTKCRTSHNMHKAKQTPRQFHCYRRFHNQGRSSDNFENLVQIFEVVWWSTLIVKLTLTTKFVSVSVLPCA